MHPDIYPWMMDKNGWMVDKSAFLIRYYKNDFYFYLFYFDKLKKISFDTV
jgi:hypothetical protein